MEESVLFCNLKTRERGERGRGEGGRGRERERGGTNLHLTPKQRIPQRREIRMLRIEHLDRPIPTEPISDSSSRTSKTRKPRT